jgi:modification methylase
MVVLDPFCGTGTTLVAAKLLGHKFIGIDISPDYTKYAKKRLSNSDNELEQVNRELSLHVIDDSFAERKKRGTVNWPFGPKPQAEENEEDEE